MTTATVPPLAIATSVADRILLDLLEHLETTAYQLADRILVATNDEGIRLLAELDETIAMYGLVVAMLQVSA